MRFVHTSDWHLGRRLAEHSLVNDQRHALEQILAICRDERADALVVAGDVFDRGVPPVEAVVLLSEVLERASRDLRIPVVVTSGNHDSAERLGFGAPLFERGGVHLRTEVLRRAEPVVVCGVPIYGLPYLEPTIARGALGDEALSSHEDVVRAALVAVADDRARRGARAAVLVAHLFAQGGHESPESERPVGVGGAGQVPVDALAGFSYVALGHLHAPQPVGGLAHVRYSGSLLKYSVREADQKKSVTVVDLDGEVSVAREILLAPLRDVVHLEAPFRELLERPDLAFAERAYVDATYTDTGYVIEAGPRLRERFPFLLGARPREVELAVDAPPGALPRRPVHDGRELLTGFWKHVQGEEDPLEDGHLSAFEQALSASSRSAGDAPA